MSRTQVKSRPKSKGVDSPRHRASQDATGGYSTLCAPSSRLGAFYSAGPVFGLGAPVQAKVAIGRANDPYEREADAVADRVTTGGQAPPISVISAGGLNGIAQRQIEGEEEPEDLTPGQIPVQRQETAEEKEQEETPPVQTFVQCQETTEEEKPEETPPVQTFVQRQETEEEKEPEETPPVQTLVQRQEMAEEELEESTPVQTFVQRQAEEEEPVQELAVQRQAEEDDEPVQKLAVQRQVDEEESVQESAIQRQADKEEPVQEMAVQREVSEDMLPPVVKREVELAKAKRDNKMPADEDLQPMAIQRQVENEEPIQGLAIQRQAEDEELVQEMAIQRQPEDEEEMVQEMPVQRRADDEELVQEEQAEGGGTAMESVAAQAISSKDSGEPLQNSTRETLESSMGTDLSDVRVHSDSRAQEATKGLNARAFTHKNDIWLGTGESQDNLSLMAHETTHILQQSADVQRRVVQRAKKKYKPNPADAATIVGKDMTIPKIQLPKFREKATISQPLPEPEKRTNQRSIWKNKISITGYKSLFSRAHPIPMPDDPKRPFYFFKVGNNKNYLIGDEDTIKKNTRLPHWDREGKLQAFDVDHIHELQLGGKADKIENMELLNPNSNRSSGAKIMHELKRRISRAVNPHHLGKDKLFTKPNVTDIRKNYSIRFTNVEKTLPVKKEGEPHWGKGDIEKGEHLEQLTPLDAAAIKKEGLRGKATRLLLFATPGGARPIKITWEAKQDEQKYKKDYFLPGFRAESIKFTPESGGHITGTLFRRRKGVLTTKKTDPWKIVPLRPLGYAGYIDQSSILGSVRLLEAEGLSPVEFSEAYLDPIRGFVASGKLKPTVPLLGGVEIDIFAEGDNIIFSKSFTPENLKFPGPIDITESTLTVSASTKGLEVAGDLLFEVKKLGKGKLEGFAKKSNTGGNAFGLKGKFEFDTELFDKAEIRLGYENNKFSGGGTLKIKKGKVKGIKSASIDINVDGEKWDAKGSVQPDLPGIKQAALEAKYDPEHGLVIGGKLDLSEDLPRVKGGSVEAKVTQKEDGKYKVAAGGSAELDIPGVDASVDVKYDDGLFLASGTVAYKKGMLEGRITAGATNMAVSDEGMVLPGEPGKKFTPFGSGTVSVTVAPWLKGTVGIKLKPNEEIVVTGAIDLPSSIEIFRKLEYKKNIFETPSIDIPILGFTVPVIGTRVGVFATIKGGMDAHASIGAGELTDLGLSITYNPQREEETRVHGKARLHIPAEAGLSLYVKGGLGVGIPIVDAEAGLKVTGELGIEGAATAAVEVDWTPAKGLVLDAKGEIYAEPKFKFSIDAYALVEVDLPWPFDDRTLYDETWNLASFEYGSGLRFGLLFPFHYEEGKTPDIALDDVEFKAPKIGVKDVISGIVKQIV